MNNTLVETNFSFQGQSSLYKGKVRDVYIINDKLVMIASDRISAFDHILPKAIPYKGQVLNQIAYFFLNATKNEVPNWLDAIPHPNISIGKVCKPIRLEMVVRQYLEGHAWREYEEGKRNLCGVPLKEGLRRGEKLTHPIITPSTKAIEGHDEDISKIEILERGIITKREWNILEEYSLKLFELGSQMAKEKGLILVDTKYEFGYFDGKIIVMDEIHTPDSSRYYFANRYEQRLANQEPQQQLSKEFVREWLMSKGFQGRKGDKMPNMTNDFVNDVSNKYIQLYELITGLKFQKSDYSQIDQQIEKSVHNYFVQ